jgi:Domain of unknown function (DUF6473)
VSIGYQRADAHIIDYELHQLPGLEGAFRGPPIHTNEYLACLGGAQTFGRFVQTPFPRLISHAIGIESLNLGRGGAGPSFYYSDSTLLGYINRARFVIVQVLSGRSQSNSLFCTTNHGMLGLNLAEGREVTANDFYTWLMNQDEQLVRKIVAETRDNYVLAMTQLLHAITPPKILLWLSVRSPEYPEHWGLPVWRLWGEFPQLVNREMIDRLQTHADIYVECISRRGLPQRLFDRSGNPTSFKPFHPFGGTTMKTENSYYPSPEMHEDAAALLIPACREILSRAKSSQSMPAPSRKKQ